MSNLPIVLVIAAGALAILLAYLRYRRVVSVRGRTLCPRSGSDESVLVTAMADRRTRRWLEVQDCSRFCDPDVKAQCSGGCLDVLNLRLGRDDTPGRA